MIKQIAIVSGKGGTGKTTLTGSLSVLFKNHVAADCDVDASNLSLLLNPKTEKIYDYYGGKKAFIDHEKCSGCGICKNVCRFEAIYKEKDKNLYSVDPFACEGCNRCVINCPENAIELLDNRSGEYYVSHSDIAVIHANLEPGEETSGGLVAEVRKKAIELAEKENNEYILIDGAPGIGCPATSSIAGVNYVIIVTEPTQSGVHDLKRIVDTVRHFKRKFSIVINKYDINNEISKEIEEFSKNENIEILGKIPFDKTVVNAVVNGEPVVNYDCPATNAIKEIYTKILKI